MLFRSRAAGLQYVVKRGRAVEFVPGPLQTPTVGVTPTGTVGETPTDIVGVTPTVTVGVTPTPLVTSRDNSSSQTSTRQLKPVFEALQDYGPADIDAARRILNSSRTHTPDATVEEVVHFIHEKGRLTQHGRIGNPVAFLIVYVPKCFQGEAIISHRERQSARQREEEQQVLKAGQEIDEERRKQVAILRDPNSSGEDKKWARWFLDEWPIEGERN